MEIIFALLVFLFDYEAPVSLTSTIPITINEDQNFEHKMKFNDAVGRAEVSFIQLPDWLEFNYDKYVLYGTPDNEDVGKHIIEFKLYDYMMDPMFYKYEIEVVNTNDAPRFASVKKISTVINEKFRFIIEYNDDDGDSVNIKNITFPEWIEYNESELVLEGTPSVDDLGHHEVSIDLTDGIVTVNYTVDISVEEPNGPPVFTNIPDPEIDEDVFYKYIPITKDKDGDDIKIEALDLPDWLSYNASSNAIQGLPKNRDVGTHTIRISATDNINPPTIKNFTIKVENVNDAPVINNPPDKDEIYIQEGEYFEYKFEILDEDKNDKIDLDVFESPSWLSFNKNGHFIYGTAELSTRGKKEKVRVKVIDEAGEMDECIFWIEVGLSAEAQDNLDWEAIKYAEYINSGEKSYQKIDDLKLILDDMISYDMKKEMKEKFGVGGRKVSTCFVVEPNAVTIVDEKFKVERCIIIKFKQSEIIIDFRQDYSISKYKGDYIFVSK